MPPSPIRPRIWYGPTCFGGAESASRTRSRCVGVSAPAAPAPEMSRVSFSDMPVKGYDTTGARQGGVPAMITTRPRRCLACLIGVFSVGVFASVAAAQQPPFFGGGAVAFDPEISVVNSGALLDAQVVVSHDRRYVTINARA